jgi:hypothetical protein
MFFRDYEDGEWSDEIRHFVGTLSKTLHITDKCDPRADLEDFKRGLEDDLDIDAGNEEDVYNFVNKNWPDILEKSGKIFKHVHYLETAIIGTGGFSIARELLSNVDLIKKDLAFQKDLYELKKDTLMESLNELDGEVADEVKDQVGSVYDEFYSQID